MEALLQQTGGLGGVDVVAVTCAAEAEALLALFRQVAREQGWSPGEDLRAYAADSRFFALRSSMPDGTFLGGLHLVRGNAAGNLPCRSVWPELNLAGRTDIADVALLALCRECRGTGSLFWLLGVALWRFCRVAGITELWAKVTPANLRVYQRLGWPFLIAGPLRPHWGEPCYPCRATLAELERAIRGKAERSERYERIVRLAEGGQSEPQEGVLLSPGLEIVPVGWPK